MGFTSRGLIPGTNGSGELSFVVSFVVIGDTVVAVLQKQLKHVAVLHSANQWNIVIHTTNSVLLSH